jgi:hypothetical protein
MFAIFKLMRKIINSKVVRQNLKEFLQAPYFKHIPHPGMGTLIILEYAEKSQVWSATVWGPAVKKFIVWLQAI